MLNYVILEVTVVLLDTTSLQDVSLTAKPAGPRPGLCIGREDLGMLALAFRPLSSLGPIIL